MTQQYTKLEIELIDFHYEIGERELEINTSSEKIKFIADTDQLLKIALIICVKKAIIESDNFSLPMNTLDDREKKLAFALRRIKCKDNNNLSEYMIDNEESSITIKYDNLHNKPSSFSDSFTADRFDYYKSKDDYGLIKYETYFLADYLKYMGTKKMEDIEQCLNNVTKLQEYSLEKDKNSLRYLFYNLQTSFSSELNQKR